MVVTHSGYNTGHMKREEIEQLLIVQLVTELKKYGLPVSPNPVICAGTLVFYFEENSSGTRKGDSSEHSQVPAPLPKRTK